MLPPICTVTYLQIGFPGRNNCCGIKDAGNFVHGLAQVRELLDALNLITDESNRTNASLEMLFREKAESLQSSFKRKMG